MPVQTYCDLPYIDCPHCGESWYYGDFNVELIESDKLTCEKCGKPIYIGHINVSLTLNDEPSRKEKST